ncbi:putative catalyzes the formation of phosphatidylethanolamine (PtdEtn) from phosphatidylserine (PtdSer) [Lyophyllum shimeji]|uniref:Catalyzes the formation of phosphatidylethanolamine (PtdEtn) from phosphatidylserine (PtdSer) n=1 Tax=Lyophyllum shimeji TaxID=47721 RepID=A0A9P3PYP2_LYOSH|nr:putative catalyzes the formation of phosphatidylethanolamine (PtdEtn) from phosphatidylserine (PtdSer) [Lyophyllum shimeji]
MLEVLWAEDLPKLKNSHDTHRLEHGPFVVICFGKKVFRTCVIRHSLNPTFEEKLVFRVRLYETTFSVQLSVHDWDKLSSKDHIGYASFEVRELVEQAPQKNPETGSLRVEGCAWTLRREKVQPHHPCLHKIPALRPPVPALLAPIPQAVRHGQYRCHLAPRAHLHARLARLDAHARHVNTFFTMHRKDPHRDELTIEEAIACLETELGRPEGECRRVEGDNVAGAGDTSVVGTPAVLLPGAGEDKKLDLSEMDFSGPIVPAHLNYCSQLVNSVQMRTPPKHRLV